MIAGKTQTGLKGMLKGVIKGVPREKQCQANSTEWSTVLLFHLLIFRIYGNMFLEVHGIEYERSKHDEKRGRQDYP